MHSFKIALLAVAASLVRAQDLSQVPSCALGPAVAALGATGCSSTDFKCICSSPTFISSLTPAVTAACSASDLAKAEAFAVSLCASYGITLNLGGSTSAAPATSAPPATSVAPASPSSTSPSAVAPSSSAAPASSSPAAPVSSAAGASTVYVTVPCSTSVYSSAAAVTTPITTAASNVTVSATKTASPSVFTGAAAAGYVSSVTLFGGVAAVLGALML